MSAAGRLGQSSPACLWREYQGFPDLAALHALAPDRYPHLLESVAHGTAQARYDVLFAFPGSTLKLTGNGHLVVDEAAESGEFLSALDSRWRHDRIADVVDLPFPFHGGWFLYLGYELAEQIEPTMLGMSHDRHWPIALAQRFPAAVIRDHSVRRTYMVCEPGHAGLLSELHQDLQASAQKRVKIDLPAVLRIQEEEPTLHRTRIAQALEYIRAGDTFQVNLSRAWEFELHEPTHPHTLYARLRQTNPAPFAALVRLDDGRAIVSSSPERLVHTRRGAIVTRPIAGTRPRRAEAPDHDATDQRALIAHPKERAEHVMLVDLERNDLGRVCIPGSVRVDELLAIESYRHVHHLVSNVRGTLRPHTTPGDVIRALFPGGTITGCPKVRTMQIIAELEAAPRRAYTGSVGYLNRDGSLDLNILIRSLEVEGRHVRLRAGGGIVADSIPEREIDETRAKARGLLKLFSGEEGGC